MRVLMTGGGTAGHVNPALAIAEIIKANEPDSEIAFVGRENGIENKLVSKAGYKLYHVEIQGIKRSLSPSNIKTAYLILTSPRKARRVIEEFKPDIVIGTGGYVCWPLLKAAAAMGIPTALHESNAVAGLAVKQLKNKADLIMTNFSSTTENLKAKAKLVCVGNPISSDFGRYTREEARRMLGIPKETKTVILSYGGSLGSKRINEACLEVMRDVSALDTSIMHYHSRGRIAAEETCRLFSEYGLEDKKNIVMSDYIYNMPVLMAAADIVICRAGAMTLSEIAAMKKCAVVIPSPNVTDNHQYKNAKVLSDAGAALLVEEKEICDGYLCEKIRELIADSAKRADMEKKIYAFVREDVDRLIYSEILELLK